MLKKRNLIINLLIIFSIAFLVACGSDTNTASTEKPAAESAVQPETEEKPVSENGDRVQIRWFVGLGTGTDIEVRKPQEEFVAKYNASQNEIELILEIVDADNARDVLSTQIAAGNPPNIVGPMGIKGRAAFPGAWLDLQPFMDQVNYDVTDFDPALIEFYRLKDQGQLGIPFAVFPSFLYINKDLFDEAGLPYPPQEYGAPYIDENGEEQEWNIETLRELAMKLSVDADGNDATSPEFDHDNIVQFGFGVQFTDFRGRATLFGPGNFIDENGQAQIPSHWVTAMKWYHQAMWVDGFHPNDLYGQSDMMGAGNWFGSGNLAIAHIHLWYAGCCIEGLEAEWDTAVNPSVNGVTTAKLHADTFSILKDSDNQAEAFEVLTYMLGPEGADELSKLYGGMPARLSLQDSFFEDFAAEKFSDRDINWDVVVESLSYPDNPNHEEWIPSFAEATDRYVDFDLLTNTKADVDIDAELETLKTDLQAIFDAAK